MKVPTSWRPARRDVFTGLRVLVCGLLLLAFTAGGFSPAVRMPVVLAVATVFGVLVTYELYIRDVPQGWVLAALLVILGASLGGYAVWLYLQPPAPTGPLRPAHDLSPESDCPQKPGQRDLLVAFGTDRVVARGDGPVTPIYVADCPVLSLKRGPGGLMVNASFYDWSNDIAFRIENNIYEPFAPLQLYAWRPDPSTLIVLDRFEKEVLYVRYLNPHAVRIRGRFLCGEAPQAVIHDNQILVGGVRMNGVFIGQRRTMGHVCATVSAGSQGGITILGQLGKLF
jgi:hypothetical protein